MTRCGNVELGAAGELSPLEPPTATRLGAFFVRGGAMESAEYDPLAEPVTATEAATRLRVSVDTVMQWARRGWLDGAGERRFLEVCGLSKRNKPMYRFGDVARAERDTRRRAGRSYQAAA